MRVWTKIAVATTIVVGSGGFGAAAAIQATGPGEDPGGPPAPAATTSDLGQGVTESKYVAVQPCRIVDTRQQGGTIANNEIRNFEVTGTGGFESQGGTPGGCNIPEGANAVELSLTIVDASGGGFMRVFPGGTSEPNATFINYSPFNPTNTGTITLCAGTCGDGDLRVRGHGTGTTTDVVIEVQGFYAKPLAAEIDGDATVTASSRLVSVSHPSTGVYYLTFDRDVQGCIAIAAPYYAADYVAAVQAQADGTVLVIMRWEASGANVDARFQAEVTC